jgi:hypothetical protein
MLESSMYRKVIPTKLQTGHGVNVHGLCFDGVQSAGHLAR